MENFAQKLLQFSNIHSDRVAIHLLHSRLEDQALTYRDLVLGAASYVNAYEQHNVPPGEVVILILDHGADLVYAFWGAILAGSIPAIMPFLTEKLSPEAYHRSLIALFEITRPAAVVTAPEFAGDIKQAFQDIPVRPKLILPGDVKPGPIIDLNNLAGLKREPNEIVLLQHSSGTTGLQKGVALSHLAIINQISSYSKALGLKDTDVVVSWLPLYHDMGLIAGFILPILSAIPLVLMSPLDWVRAPYKLLQAISKYQGTLCWQPNFAYNFCAQKIRDRDLVEVDLSSLRALINCSEPMYWESHQMFLERFAAYGFGQNALATSYAMAENVFAVTQGGIGSPITVDVIDGRILLDEQKALPGLSSSSAIKMLSAGKPIDNTRVRVIDAQGQDLPNRHVGELAIQSDCMLTGYYKRPDLADTSFLDGWYLTGDLGYLADGEVYITGRKKDLIIVGGKNIYPQDIERLVNEVPGVHPGRSVAFGIHNPQLGTEEVVVVAETDHLERSSDPNLANNIRQYVTQRSDIALRYVQIVERDWLLKTSSGKIARSANRAKYLQETEHV